MPAYDYSESGNTNGMVALASYFGFMADVTNYTPQGDGSEFGMNHMFTDGRAGLGELKSKFNSLFMAGNPLVATLKDLEVSDNPYWGTTAEDMVDLTVIYYANVPKKFSNAVRVDGKRLETDKNGYFTDPELSRVPNVQEFGENLGDFDIKAFNIKTLSPKIVFNWIFKRGLCIAAFTSKQVNMVRILGSGIIDESWHGLNGHDGLVKFDEFKDFFEGKPNSKGDVDVDDDNDDDDTG